GCRSKKKKTVLAAETGRPDIARRRARWRRHQHRIDPRRLVFIEETWVQTNMAPRRGRGPRGTRLPGRAPQGHWRRMTFVGAPRMERIDAPCV
ncbi:IS630 family transposase, partial [Paracoccus sp. APAP_BH8]